MSCSAYTQRWNPTAANFAPQARPRQAAKSLANWRARRTDRCSALPPAHSLQPELAAVCGDLPIKEVLLDCLHAVDGTNQLVLQVNDVRVCASFQVNEYVCKFLTGHVLSLISLYLCCCPCPCIDAKNHFHSMQSQPL